MTTSQSVRSSLLIAIGICVAASATVPTVRGESPATTANSTTNLAFEVASIRLPLGGPPQASAQAVVERPTVAFDVASIRPNTSDQRGGNTTTLASAGRFASQNSTLLMLVKLAYAEGVPPREFQVSGGPSWVDQDRFDVDAKAAGPVDGDRTLYLMLRSLLADRFQLKLRREQRPAVVNALSLVPNRVNLRKVDEASLNMADPVTPARFLRFLVWDVASAARP